MPDYMLTAHSTGLGWRDIQVDNCPDIHTAIALAEQTSGCRVSHGRGGVLPGFHPGIQINADTGDVTEHPMHMHARPEVYMGPPDVMRAIAQALQR